MSPDTKKKYSPQASERKTQSLVGDKGEMKRKTSEASDAGSASSAKKGKKEKTRSRTPTGEPRAPVEQEEVKIRTMGLNVNEDSSRAKTPELAQSIDALHEARQKVREVHTLAVAHFWILERVRIRISTKINISPKGKNTARNCVHLKTTTTHTTHKKYKPLIMPTNTRFSSSSFIFIYHCT
jgi:hypothetical protein